MALNRTHKAGLYTACLLASLTISFRSQLLSSFTLLLGDRFDGVIEVAILEHWFNVVRGIEPWNQTLWFHPYRDTLAYNDGFFLYGLAYALFRSIGADVFLAAELVNILLRAVAFAAMEQFLRRCLRLATPFALGGATLFALSFALSMHAEHAQLLSVAFIPLLATLAWTAAQAFERQDWPGFLGIACLASLLLGTWLLTAFYTAWFTLFLLACTALLAALTERRRLLCTVRALPPAAWASLAAAAILLALATLPFLVAYLPKARATGMHSRALAFYYATNPLDLLHTGPGNLLLSPLDAILQRTFRPRGPDGAEHTVGLTWTLLAVFLLACVRLWRTRRTRTDRPMALVAAATILVWLITVRYGAWSPWFVVRVLVPGAKALRVVVRYQLVMLAPVIAVAAWYLARTRLSAVRIALIAVLLLTEQIATAPPLRLDRPQELARVRAIPAPPPACRSFFVARGRPATPSEPPSEINAIYSHNVDAMLLAERFALPTVNGFSTFNPPDWNFVEPDAPDYQARIRTYAQAHTLEHLCALDLTSLTWSEPPP